MAEELLIIYSDGACRGNPGPSAVGVSLQFPDGTEFDHLSELIGNRTNNEAEYHAVLRGLERAAANGDEFEQIEMRTDSQLLVRQLNGTYKTRDPKLVGLRDMVRIAEKPFRAVSFVWVRREHPGAKRADALANQALTAAGHPKSKWPGAGGG